MNKKLEVFLSQEELEQLVKTKKKIGQGKEGKIYRAEKGLLYKIYYKLSPHEREKLVRVPLKIYEIDEDGVKRVKEDANIKMNIEKKVTLNPFYIDRDGVKKVYSVDYVNEAVKRQPMVKNTTLPLGAIYIDNRFGGVILKEHKGHFDIHNIAILPLKSRLNILKKVLENLKELCDNNIYPIDFGNRSKNIYDHSNILVNIKGNVEFIDLEGRSTIYTREPNDNLKVKAYAEFYFLFLDIMFDEILDGEYEEDIDYVEHSLERKNLSKEYIKYIRKYDYLEYDVLKNLVSDFVKIKR
ncbi:MAG TPA: hypothetical protein GXZ95_05315 [Mollicutes bacterium]|nr:hypothetical protein [Mollicutes bacterium]